MSGKRVWSALGETMSYYALVGCVTAIEMKQK